MGLHGSVIWAVRYVTSRHGCRSHENGQVITREVSIGLSPSQGSCHQVQLEEACICSERKLIKKWKHGILDILACIDMHSVRVDSGCTASRWHQRRQPKLRKPAGKCNHVMCNSDSMYAHVIHTLGLHLAIHLGLQPQYRFYARGCKH